MSMRSWIRSLFARRRPRTIRKAPARRPLCLEVLEDRLAPSVSAIFNASTKVLAVTLSAPNDQATIAPSGANISVSGTGYSGQAFSGVTSIVVTGANTSSQDVPNQSVLFGGSGGTITLNAASGADALNVTGVTSVLFSDVTIDATSGNVNVTASETTSASGVLASNAPQASVSVTGAAIKADNITLEANASSTYTPNSDPFGGALNALGAAAAIADLEPSATVAILGSSSLTANGNVTIGTDAGATVNSDTTVGTDFHGTAVNPVAAAIAESVVNSSAVTHVGGGSAVSAGSAGTVSITSINTTNVTTEVNGSAAVGGATAAVTLDNSTSQAFMDGGSTASGGTVDVLATTTNTANTSATSMATGAGSNSAIQNILAGKVDPAYLASVDPPPPPPGHDTSPAETAESGGLPLSVAGAVAVTKFTPTTQAYVDSSMVTATNAIDIGASANNSTSTTADGNATTSNANLSVGVAVAISDTDVSNTATVENTAGTASPTTLTAPTITVQAGTPPAVIPTGGGLTPDLNAAASATCGVSGSNVGAAGALALNIVSNTNEASVPSGSTVAMIGNVTFNAQDTAAEGAAAQPPIQAAGGAGGAVGIGASVALNIDSNTTLADLQDTAQLTGANNLTFTAGSNDTVDTYAASGATATGAVSLDPSVGISLVTNTTEAQVGAPDAANNTLVIGGAFSATATHSALTSTASGADAGGGTAVSAGVSIALAFVTDQTTATTGRSIDAQGGGVTLEADGSAASLVSAIASASGGPTQSQESQEPDSGPADGAKAGPGSDTADPNSVDGQNAEERSYADGESGTLSDSKGDPVPVHDTGSTDTPAAKTSDGSVTVAAAVALNIVNSNADATIPAGLTITAAGPLTVSATNDTGDPDDNPIYNTGDTGADANPDSPVIIGDTANAWGAAAGTARVGIGAAVAVNLVNASAEATIQSSSSQPTTINTDGVIVSAGMLGATPMNTFGANSTSGAGAGDIALAGAVAINIVSNTSQALIEPGASVNAHGGDVSVTSLNNSTDITFAVPGSPATGGSLGIGASLALNIITDTTQSEVQNGAALTNAGNVTVTAASSHAINTWAQNGAAGAVALGGGIAIVTASAPTTAYVGSDAQTLNASGDVTIGASGAFAVNSVAAAATNPTGAVGIGASVVVNVAQDSFQAELDRNVTAGGAVSITADPVTATSQAAAIASEQGAKPPSSSSNSGDTGGSDGTADEESQNQANYAAGEDGSTPTTLPKSNDEMSSPSSSASGKSGGEGGVTEVGIAAAVAVNVLTTSTVAKIGNGLTVTAGGSLTVGTTNQSSALALADGRATTNQASIGAAVSLNVANVTNTATIGSGDTISADGVSVTALMATGSSGAVTPNDFSTQGLGIAIGAQVGVAGSVGINVITINTQASIGAGSVVTSFGGLTVQAGNDETLQNIAYTLAVGGDVGAGAAVNVNVLNNTTNAFIDASVQANVADMTQVTAESSLNPSQDPVPNSPADAIVATGTGLTPHEIAGVPVPDNYDVDGINGSVISTATPAPKAGDTVDGPGIPVGTVVAGTSSHPFTGVLAFGSNVVASDDPIFVFDSHGIPSPLGPQVGDTVIGPGILPGATITSISENLAGGATITLSLPAIGSGAAPLIAAGLVLANPVHSLPTTGAVTLFATPDDLVAQALSSVHPTNFAAGAGVSSGGAGIAGSFIVNVINQTTLAYIGTGASINTKIGMAGNPTANSDEGVTVAATETMNVVDWAGAIGGGADVGFGAALDVNIVTEDAQAYVASSATVDAAQNVMVTSSTNGTFQSITAAAGLSGSVGIAGAVSIEVLAPTTNAFIDQGATVNAQGDLLVQASRQATIDTGAGQLSVGGDASVGAAVSTIVDTVNTDAYIGSNDQITAKGTSGTVPVLTGNSVGDTTPFSGVAVVAATFQNVQAIVVGGAASETAAVAGSASVNVLSDTTLAYIGAGAIVYATSSGTAAISSPGSGPGVMVTAADFLTLLSTAGALAVAVNADPNIGVGIGADVASITKNTQAYIATANISADGDVLIQAKSLESLASISVSAAVAVNVDPYTGFVSAAVGGSAGVYVLNITTRAFIGNDPDNPTSGSTNVQAGGSILVAASESNTLNLLSGGFTAGEGSVGAAATVPIITKTTEAFIGAGAQVAALGQGNAIPADNGLFDITYQGYGTSPGQVTPNPISANLTSSSNPNNNDLTAQRLTQQRVATPETTPIHGLAVTAVNSDNLQGVGVDAGGGGIALHLSGSVGVITNHTDAYVGSGAKINSSNANAASCQAVLVAAGNDASFLGIAAAASLSAIGLTPGVVVLVINNTTTASIDDGASVAALGDVDVLAHSSGDVLTIAAGVAVGGTVLAGSVSYIGVNDTTTANIGNSATTDGAGAEVNAGGNVLVDATDNTAAFMITGSISLSFEGDAIGAAVNIVDLSKNTSAFIGNHATVNALGNTSSLSGIFDGNYTTAGGFEPLTTFHGVAVQAASSENVTNVAAAGSAGGDVGLAGGVSIELFNSNTQAYVGNNAHINTASVDVAAVNQASNFSFAGGLTVGGADIAGGVDVGLLKNLTRAYICNGAVVDARQDVDVYALSNDTVQTYALGAAVGAVGLVGSVSVWSIGEPYSAGYTDGNASDGTVPSLGDNSGVTDKSASAESNTGGASSMLSSLLDPQYNGAAANTQYISGTDDAAQTGANGAINGDPVANAIASTPPLGTVAFIGSNVSVNAGGNVNIQAQSKVSYTGIVGGLAVGAVGIGGSVEIANIEGNTQAYIDENSTVSAGGNVAVNANLVNDTSSGTAFAGTAGIVGIGAQVVDIQDSSTESAALNGGVTIPQAQQVQVTAESNRSLTAQAIGGDIGTVGAGVGVAIANAAGSTTASIGSGDQIGQTGTVGDGGVEVAATSADKVMAKSYGVAAGAAGALTGVYASGQSEPNVTASIADSAASPGNTAITTTGGVTVTATNTPNVSATALGVAVAGFIGIGAVVSNANVAGTTSGYLGNNVTITATSLTVNAMRTEDANSDPTAQANADAGAGGILAGINATVSTATSGGMVQATTGSSVTLPNGDVTIAATNQSDQSANATGVAVGELAIGADVATANSNVATLAQLGSGAITDMGRTGALTVQALGTDENDASSTAGSGGIIAGDASVGNTNDTSTVSACLGGGGGTLWAGAVEVSATNNSVYTPDVNSVNAALAGASGALADNNDTTAANATVLANTVIMASFAADVAAHNTFTENVPTSGNTVSAGAGGFLNGTAALSETTITGNANVTIGNAVTIDVFTLSPPSSGNPGIFLTASSLLTTNDQVTLSTGGALEGAGTDSSLSATLNNNVVTQSTAAGKDVFTTNQNIGIGTYTTVDADDASQADTWGVLGALASASAETNVTSNQTVTLAPYTDLTAYQNINVTAGDATTSGGNNTTTVVGAANAQSYVRGFVAIPTTNATSTLNSNATLTVGTNDLIFSGADITLGADHGNPSATAVGIGHGYELGFIPVTNGNSTPTASTSSTVTLDGTITAGIFDQLNVTIPSNGPTIPVFSEPDSPITVASPAFSFSSSFDPSSVINNSSLSAMDKQLLLGSVSSTPVDAMTLGTSTLPLTANGGNVTVNAGTLHGAAAITAYGAPTIDITNNSPDYLVLGPIVIPDLAAGHVVFTGTATAAPAGMPTPDQVNAGGSPIVNIQELYDQPVGASSSGPAVFVTGEVSNLGGQVSITNTFGSVIQLSAIDANQIDITAPNGALVVDVPNGPPSYGTEFTGSSPFSQIDQSMIWPGGNPATVVNLSGNDAVAYVANAEFNTNGAYTPSSNVFVDSIESVVFTGSLIGEVGDTPPQSFIGPNGAYEEPSTPLLTSGTDGLVREAGTSLVFYGSNTGDNTSITPTDAASQSPADADYEMGGNNGAQDEGYFPVVPVEPLQVQTQVFSGSLTANSDEVVVGNTNVFFAGESITGPGIPAGTTIGSIDPIGPYLYLSAAATSSGSMSLTAGGIATAPSGNSSAINAGRVIIQANVIDLDSTVNVGLPNNWSVNLPASLDSIIAADHAQGGSTLYSLPLSTVSSGDQQITAQYDAVHNQIMVNNVNASSGAGFLSLDGAIINTSGQSGNIHVNDGNGQVTIDNETGVPVVVNNVNAGSGALNTAPPSVVDIIDTNQAPATEQTLYVYNPGGGIDTYQGNANLSLQDLQNPSYLKSATSANSTSYSPEAGLRYQWQLQANLARTVDPAVSSSNWSFETPPGESTANDPWYYLDANGDPTAVVGGSSTPFGQLVQGPSGGPAFEEAITGAVQQWTEGLFIYHNGDYGFAPTPTPEGDYTTGSNPHAGTGDIEDPWVYYYAIEAQLTLTDSVAADNPISIDFAGSAQSSVRIDSDAAVSLEGNIVNPDGATSIVAPSITQSSTANITSNNLTLTATTGGVGAATQPVSASLTANGVLNVQAGSQGAYLNLGSGALLGTVNSAGNVVINATNSLAAAPGLPSGTVNVTGSNLTLNSSEGAVGTAATPLQIEATGVVNVSALGDIGLTQASGDLQVGQIVSTSGDVTITATTGAIENASGTTWTDEVDSTQSQQVWQNLGLTNPFDAVLQAIIAFENQVNADYAAYWQLLDDGSVNDGVFTLNSQGLALYSQQAGQAQNPPTTAPTNAEVQSYANNQYQNDVAFFNQNLGSNWMTTPDFTTYNPNFNYQATSQQESNLESNAAWTTSELMNPVAQVAVDPVAGAPVGITTPNISGANVMLMSGGSIGQTSAATDISLADIQSGNLTAAQVTALGEATAAGGVVVTSTGIQVSPGTQLFVSATGALAAGASGSVTLQSTAPNLTLNHVTAGGPVNIAAPGSIFSSGAGTQISTTGNTVLKATGTVGSPTTPLNVNIAGTLNAYTPPGKAFINGIQNTTSLAISSDTGNSSTYGASVTITATISDTGAGVPTGSVEFYDGTTPLGIGSSLSGSGNSATSTFTSSALAAGLHALITAVYMPSGNFAGSSGNLSLMVSPATLTITATSTSKLYGQTATFANSAFTETGLATANGDTITGVSDFSSGAAMSATVGAYNIVPYAAAGTGLNNYTINYVNGTLTVNPASLTITANSAGKTYGTLKAFSDTAFTESGLVTANGDTITGVTETSTGAPVSATVASYNIVASAAAGTHLSNYTINYVNGTLSVNPATLTITADNASKTYGTLTTFSGAAFTETGLVTANGDFITGVTETSTGAPVSATVGSYNIVASAAAGTRLGNYTISYNNGTLTVNPATLTITANSGSKTYGTLATFSGTAFTETGLVTANGDTLTGVSESSTGVPVSATVASYNIVPSAATGARLNNYTISYINGTLSVNPATLTITANGASKTYGTLVSFSGAAFTETGLVTTNGDTITGVSESSTGAPVSAAVGNYNIVASAATGTDLDNYTISYVNGTLTVNPATLTITANNASKTYGTLASFSGTAFTETGLVTANGDTITGVTETSTGAATSAAVGSYDIVASAATGTGLGNYTIGYINGTLTVNKAILTITANSASKTYGTLATFSGTAFTETGLANGDTITGVTETSTGAPAAATAGSYDIVASAATGTGLDDYTIRYVNGTLTVNKAALTVTADNESKVYGGADPSLTYTVSGTLYNGDTATVVNGVTLSTATGSAATAGTHTITVSGGTAANYAITDVNGTLTVAQASLTVTANNQSKTYGGADPTLTYTPSGTLYYTDTYAVITGVVLSTTTGAAATAGTHTIVATGGTAANYAITDVNGTLTVSQAPLTVTANNQSKTYGGADPDLTYTVSGAFYNGDTAAVVTGVTLSTATGSAATAGTHTITASGGTAANYAITDVNGTLAVAQAPLTVTADNQSKTYGGADPTLTYTPSGTLYYTDTYGVITGVALSTTTGAAATAGTHTIAATGGTAANYAITDVNGTLAVAQAPLTVTADNQSKTYGGADPTLTYTPSGTLYYTDTYGVITGVALSTTTGAAATAGTHTIAATGGTAANYAITDVNGTLAVAQAPLTVTADNQSKTYGATDPTLTYTPSGTLYYTDTYAVITGVVLSTTTGAAATAGTHTIVATGGTAANYAITDVNGTLTVYPAATGTVVVSSADPSVYGQAVTFTAIVTDISSGSIAVPTGIVQFVVDGSNFGNPVTVGATGNASLPDTFLAGAGHTVQALYTNIDGNFIASNSTNLTQTVQQVAVEPDPSNPALTDLFIGSNGAASNDQIQVNPVGSSNTGSTGVQVQTMLNGAHTQTMYSQSFSTIYVFLQGGNDQVQLANSLTIDAVVSTGSGNDQVQLGNSSNNSVTLGNGNDHVQIANGNNPDNHEMISLGAGNDQIQIGDGSNDTVSAGAGNDQVQIGTNNNSGLDSSETVALGTPTGIGNDNVQLGDGSHDNVTLQGIGNVQVQIGSNNNSGLDSYETVSVGAASAHVQIGDGSHDTVTGGTGNNQVQVGSNSNSGLDNSETVALGTPTGTGNDNVQLGDGSGDNVTLQGTGNDQVQIGCNNNSGLDSYETVSVGAASAHVQVGDGSHDTVTGANGSDQVQIGCNNNSGLDSSETVSLGNGNDQVQIGDGNGLSSGADHVSLGNGNDNLQIGGGNNTGLDSYDFVMLGSGNDHVQIGTGINNTVIATNAQDNVQFDSGPDGANGNTFTG